MEDFFFFSAEKRKPLSCSKNKKQKPKKGCLVLGEATTKGIQLISSYGSQVQLSPLEHIQIFCPNELSFVLCPACGFISSGYASNWYVPHAHFFLRVLRNNCARTCFDPSIHSSIHPTSRQARAPTPFIEAVTVFDLNLWPPYRIVNIGWGGDHLQARLAGAYGTVVPQK